MVAPKSTYRFTSTSAFLVRNLPLLNLLNEASLGICCGCIELLNVRGELVSYI